MYGWQRGWLRWMMCLGLGLVAPSTVQAQPSSEEAPEGADEPTASSSVSTSSSDGATADSETTTSAASVTTTGGDNLLSTAETELPTRTLNGHRFNSTDHVSDPFLTPFFENAAFIGRVQIEREIDNAEDSELDTRLLFEAFRFQISFADRVALQILGTAGLTFPRDSETAFDLALNGTALGRGGLKVKIWKNEYVQFALSGQGGYDFLQSATPSGFIESSAETIVRSCRQGDCQLPTGAEARDSLLVQQSGYQYGGGLHAAAGAHPAVGAWGTLQFRQEVLRNEEDDTSTTNVVDAGFGISLDASALHRYVPIGATFGYSYARSNEFAGPSIEENNQGDPIVSGEHSLSIGAYYTGRGYVDVGLEYRSLTETSEVEPVENIEVTNNTGTSAYLFRIRAYF